MTPAVKARVRKRAGHRCEYCQLRQDDSPLATLHVEHILPRVHGGSDDLGNLALACIDCNLHKGPNLTGIDPETERVTPLFHPRHDRWEDHLQWRGIYVRGIGDLRATTDFWLLDPHHHMDGNVALGVGFAAPTGDDAATDTAHRSTGPVERPVDPSIQPGTGGWGTILQTQAYQKIYGNLSAYPRPSLVVARWTAPRRFSDQLSGNSRRSASRVSSLSLRARTAAVSSFGEDGRGQTGSHILGLEKNLGRSNIP
jgi:hypothetical protein